MSLDLDIVLLLVVLPAARSPRVIRSILLLFPLLLFLLLFGSPDVIDIEQLDSNDIAFKGTVSILGTADINICVKDFGGDVRVGTVAFVDTEDTNDELAGCEKRREGRLRKVRRKERFALRRVCLLLQLELDT